jgi:hypothetical protein
MAGNTKEVQRQHIDTVALLRDIDPDNVEAYDGVKPRIIRTYDLAINLHSALRIK